MTAPRRLKLLVYGINYAPEKTGIGRYTGDLTEWFARRGHDVTVITAPPHYPQWQIDPAYRGRGHHRERRGGVTVLRTPLALPGGPGGGLATRLVMESSFNLAAARWWLPRVVRRQHDVVLAIAPPMQGALWPWLHRLVGGIPWVLHIQDLQIDAALKLGLLPGPAPLHRLLYRSEALVLSRATRVSTITQAMQRAIVAKGIPETSTWLLPNWADPAAFDADEALVAATRGRFGIADGETLVLYSGNMGAKQDLGLILDAAERLRGVGGLQFLLVGDGVARADLERAAEARGLDRVHFADPVPRDTFPALLAAGDIHLVVQKREAADLVMPSKLTNILAAGRASVATADPGTELHDVLDRHGAGLVSMPGDAQGLADAIVALQRDDGLRSRVARSARRYAERHLEMDAILKEFEGKLLTLAAEGTGSASRPA